MWEIKKKPLQKKVERSIKFSRETLKIGWESLNNFQEVLRRKNNVKTLFLTIQFHLWNASVLTDVQPDKVKTAYFKRETTNENRKLNDH